MITQFTIEEWQNKLNTLSKQVKIKTDTAAILLTDIEKLCNEIILVESNIKQMNDQGKNS